MDLLDPTFALAPPCASERRVSVYSERYVQGALPAGVKTDCSWLELHVLKAKDRDEHKIKLLRLVAD